MRGTFSKKDKARLQLLCAFYNYWTSQFIVLDGTLTKAARRFSALYDLYQFDELFSAFVRKEFPRVSASTLMRWRRKNFIGQLLARKRQTLTVADLIRLEGKIK